MSWPGVPTLDEASELQLDITQWLGGEPGVSEFEKLSTMLDMVAQGSYVSLTEQAADLLRAIACNRCFIDANKRMSLALVARFLARNGVALKVSDREAERFVVQEVMRKRAGLEEIARWIESHSGSAR